MKGKQHFAGPQGSKVTNVVQRMLRGGGQSAPTMQGYRPAQEPIGRALAQGRNPAGKSSGGKKRR